MERKIIGVIGAGRAGEELVWMAEETGRLIAQNGFLLVCGGLGGVMEAAALPSPSKLSVEILPQKPYYRHNLPTIHYVIQGT